MILVQFPHNAVCYCLPEEGSLLTLPQSTQLYKLGKWGNTSSFVSFSKKLHSHCSSPPSHNGYLAVLALAGEGEAGQAWKPISLVDKAIQVKLIKLTLSTCMLNFSTTCNNASIIVIINRKYVLHITMINIGCWWAFSTHPLKYTYNLEHIVLCVREICITDHELVS